MTKRQMTETRQPRSCPDFVLNFEHWGFDIVSDFGFRYSDFQFSHHCEFLKVKLPINDTQFMRHDTKDRRQGAGENRKSGHPAGSDHFILILISREGSGSHLGMSMLSNPSLYVAFTSWI